MFYSNLLRFLRPEIKQIPRLLAFTSESIHENSLLDDIESVAKKIIESFIFDGIADEKIIMAINCLRIMMMRNNQTVNREQINYVASFRTSKHKQI